MSTVKLRSSSKRLRVDPDTNYICACKGKNSSISSVTCLSCGYLCCRNCIWKRFDIYSEKKYNNIIANFLCSHCTHNNSKPSSTTTTHEHEETVSSDAERSFDYDIAVKAFHKSMPVYTYAFRMLSHMETVYCAEIKQRETAISKINPSTNPITTDNNHINSISSDILKIIFIFSLGDINYGDKSVLSLIKVCKYWRNIIHSNKNDSSFHDFIWFGCVDRKCIEWHHLVLIPKEYLKLKLNLDIKPMNGGERTAYFKLLGDDDDDANDLMYSCDINVPLLIASLMKCPKISSLELTGRLCEDVFFAIYNNCKQLRSLDFSFCDASNDWLTWLIAEDSDVKNTLWNISVMRSYWCDDATLYYLSFCPNLANISSEKWSVSGDGLLYLFEKCNNLLSIRLDRYVEGCGEWENAFKCLSENNKVIEFISFNECEGFNDKCLSYLMNPKSCPKLRELVIHYHSCSEKMIQKFKKKRPKVKICGDALNF
eukprot:351476_1